MKYCDCGCAGVFSAPALPETLISFFAEHNKLDALPNFASNFGADFYGLPRVQETITFNLDSPTPRSDQYPTFEYP